MTPVQLADLRGCVVLLHFWRASDVYSRRVLPTLARLEQRFADSPFQVLGIHSGGFVAEEDPERVLTAARRLAIRHPILLDHGRAAWTAFDCHAWPTLVLLDAAGMVRWQGHGEPDRDRLQQAVGFLVDEAKAAGGTSPGLQLPEHPQPRDQLAWPERLLVDAARRFLWISDTGNHRVLAVHLDSGKVEHCIGCGLPGAGDGDAAYASFCEPRGMALHDDSLYVVDTGNHLLRQINLHDFEVTTVLGTGAMALDRDGGFHGIYQGLSSPSDLCAFGDQLLVTMQAAQQVWQVEIESMVGMPVAGGERSGLLDGVGHQVEMAQPSGMDVDAERQVALFVETGSSSVRLLELGSDKVTTLLGDTASSSGDRDGTLDVALLQAPADLALLGPQRDQLLISDTFNDKLKLLDPAAGIETLFGPGDGLVGPQGVAVHGTRVYVCNTDKQQILTTDLAAPMSELQEFEVRELPQAASRIGAEYAAVHPVSLLANTEAKLRVAVPTPSGEWLLPELSTRVWVENAAGQPLVAAMSLPIEWQGDEALVVGLPIAEASGSFRLRLSYTTCADVQGVCHFQELRLLVPVESRETALGDDADPVEIRAL